jgi:hypothetical protein
VIIAEQFVSQRKELTEFIERKLNVKVSDEQQVTRTTFTAEDANIDVVFAIKNTNLGKIESQYWFFTEFCKEMNPMYCIVSCFCGEIFEIYLCFI